MKTKLAILAGTVAAPALQASRASDPKQSRQVQGQRDTELARVRARPALIMIWRANAISGRLECRWSLERGALTDEGVSCSELLRRAA